MTLKAKNELEGKEIKLTVTDWDSLRWEHGKNATIMLQNEDEGKIIEINYGLTPDKGEHKPDEYIVYIFHNSLVSENAIFPIESDSKNNNGETMGFLFSIQALLSDEHDYRKNEHFLKYALKAFYKLLRQDDNIPFIIPDITSEYDLKLTDFYPEDSVILILWKAQIESYLPCLYQYGFHHVIAESNLDKASFKEQSEKACQYYQEQLDSLGKKIIAKRISRHLENEVYITQLFTNLLPYQLHPLVRFHLLYQIIELLIPKIASLKFKEAINNIDWDVKSLSDLKERFDELWKIQQERTNIQALFANKGVSENQAKALDKICREFLENQGYACFIVTKEVIRELEGELIPKDVINKLKEVMDVKYDDDNAFVDILKSKMGEAVLNPHKEKFLNSAKKIEKVKNPADSLYRVRNFLVHNYRCLSDKNKDEKNLEKINIAFERAIIDLLINYQE
ncbi:MAG: hypothetical protein GY862_07105 [Gammaproteobacteria bacterium]|nr:hypothetical protein [Gammaproteobacteria bacterium]